MVHIHIYIYTLYIHSYNMLYTLFGFLLYNMNPMITPISPIVAVATVVMEP